MDFDQFTVALLRHRPDGPRLDKEAAARMQDAHLNHIAGLAEAGKLVAAGPIADARLRGLSILTVPVDEARELKEADPAIDAGVFSLHVVSWQVPAGAVRFTPTRFPHSVAEAIA
jgi:uncharacterized protein YciI